MRFYIKDARELRGLSQRDLADAIGVAPNTLHGYESGKHDPKSELLVKIAAVCGVSVDFLLGIEKSEKSRISLLSANEKNHISQYLRLDTHGRAAVDAITRVELQRMEEAKEE